MDFSEISVRMRKQREADAGVPVMIDFDEAYRVRARMVGVLLRDARLKARRSLDDCAQVLRVTPSAIEAWEYGDESPSLPQLEILALFLGVPVSHFWSSATLQTVDIDQPDSQREYLLLRDRMIGALLRQAREQAALDIETLSERTGLSADQIARYELGESPLPLHELTVLAGEVNRNVSFFLESSSHIGEWLALREASGRLTEMSQEMREFILKPANRGFIEIAMLFSRMPTEQLREIGASLLDITL
jgi:transcriptional regulator with XRE-family HTH domain